MNTIFQPGARPGPRQGLPWLRVLAGAAGVLALAAFAPVVWLAAAGGAGLMLLAGLLVLGWGLVQALPLAGQKLENALLAARKAEARRNPIEQLQNEVLRRADHLKVFRRALVSVGGQIESVRDMITERQHRDPAHVLERHQRALERLQQFQGLNLRRLAEAESALQEFRATVERKQSEWQIALSIEAAAAAIDPDSADALLQDLLADTALRSVQDRFNAVFAELDVQMSSVDAPTRALLESESTERLGALELPMVRTGSRELP